MIDELIDYINVYDFMWSWIAFKLTKGLITNFEIFKCLRANSSTRENALNLH